MVVSIELTALEYWNVRSELRFERDMVRTAGVTLGGVIVDVEVDSSGCVLTVKHASPCVPSCVASSCAMQSVMCNSVSRFMPAASAGRKRPTSVKTMAKPICCIILIALQMCKLSFRVVTLVPSHQCGIVCAYDVLRRVPVRLARGLSMS